MVRKQKGDTMKRVLKVEEIPQNAKVGDVIYVDKKFADKEMAKSLLDWERETLEMDYNLLFEDKAREAWEAFLNSVEVVKFTYSPWNGIK